MIDRFGRFSFAISELSRYWHKIAADEMERHGLKGPYAVYFTTLYQIPEGVTAAKLAQMCGRDKSDVSRAVNAMESKHLLEREGASYRATLKLTEEGRKVAEEVIRQANRAVEYGGSGISEQEREIMYRCLDIIAENLQHLSEEGL